MKTKGRFLALLVVATLIGRTAVAYSPQAPVAAPAKSEDGIALSYDVYAGGMHALKAEFDLAVGPKDYSIALAAKTEGMIGSLFPWKGEYLTEGTSQDGVLQPRLHQSKSNWKEDVKTTALAYDRHGHFIESRTEKGGKETVKRNFSEKLTDETVDMLTAAVTLFQNSTASQNCAGTSSVFDGKRRFNIVFKADGEETLKPSKYSSYSGKALRCIVEVEPVAGFKKKDMKKGWMAVQEHTKERKKLPTLWLAKPRPDAPAVVPVRMEIASTYGTVVAHLSQTQALAATPGAIQTGMLSR